MSAKVFCGHGKSKREDSLAASLLDFPQLHASFPDNLIVGVIESDLAPFYLDKKTRS